MGLGKCVGQPEAVLGSNGQWLIGLWDVDDRRNLNPIYVLTPPD